MEEADARKAVKKLLKSSRQKMMMVQTRVLAVRTKKIRVHKRVHFPEKE